MPISMIIHLGPGILELGILQRRLSNNIVVTSMYFTDNADGQTCYNFAKLVALALYFLNTFISTTTIYLSANNDKKGHLLNGMGYCCKPGT